jgi:protein tyrosine phosphatase (PTP) superfamily phosphohydrolase (DUF442 family)
MLVTETVADPVCQAVQIPHQRRHWLRAAAWGCLVGGSLAVAVQVCWVTLWGNLHELIPGRIYRSSQLSGAQLEQVIQSHGIRTVINLRGCCDPNPWYLEECRATHRQNVAQEDICLSAGRLPATYELRRLLQVLDRAEYPILFHCRRGADRTGLVAALVLLLQTDADLTTAGRQLGIRYGHLSLGRPAYLDEYLDLYAAWLRQQGITHSPAALRRWIEHDYCPGVCRCTIEPLDLPTRIPHDQPMALRVRFHNTGIQTWRFRPGSSAGIHAGFGLWNTEGNCLVNGRAGMFDAKVPPGQSIELTLALPAVERVGRHHLLIDLVEEQQCWFYQTGSEPLERELEVY